MNDVIEATTRALDAYMRPPVWRALQRNAMSCDFGWNEAVEKMVALYVDVSGMRPSRTALRSRRVVEPLRQTASPTAARVTTSA